jgi:uncharacterized protein with ATP-grasp and redox domains
MDRLFIGEFGGTSVTCVAKKSPILLEATVEDARAAKLDTVSKLVDSGVEMLGTPLELLSAEFKETLKGADLIIAKGQNNIETLAGADLPPTYFCLMVQCVCAGRDLGVKVGDIVFVKNSGD